MKRQIFSVLCFVLGLVIGVGGLLIFELASERSSVPVRNQEISVSNTAGSANQSLIDLSYEALSYIKSGDYISLSSMVHPEYGIYFSPYSNINISTNQWFTADGIARLDKSSDTLVWGIYDGSGEPISLTATDYFSAFVYDRDYATAPVITVNRIAKSGNSLENTSEVFPDGKFVDFYIPAISEDVPAWSLLRLIYEDYNGSPRLVCIVHSQYTV